MYLDSEPLNRSVPDDLRRLTFDISGLPEAGPLDGMVRRLGGTPALRSGWGAICGNKTDLNLSAALAAYIRRTIVYGIRNSSRAMQIRDSS